MKLILVSDPHLVVPGVTLFGRDPLANLAACIASINREHADADLVVFAGDITNDGEAEAYAAFAGLAGRLLPPFRIVPGNHDARAALLAACPDTPQADGFIQSSQDVGTTRLILLDTLWPGHVAGLLCDRRLAWLDRELASAGEALLVMHHPPCAIGIPSLDDSHLANPESLLRILRGHGNVRHIFAGHVHRLSHGSWHGIPFTTMRGTSHQSALKFSGPHEVSFEAPTYSVVLSGPDGIVVHSCEFET